MKYVLAALLAVVLIASASSADINAKLGLAGGSARIVLEGTRQVKTDLVGSGALGYGYNSEYSLLSLELGIAKQLADNLDIGLAATYSSYSTAVSNILGAGTITDKSGIGGMLFVKKMVRDDLSLTLGYDTRMGLVVELGKLFRK